MDLLEEVDGEKREQVVLGRLDVVALQTKGSIVCESIGFVKPQFAAVLR